MGAIENKDRAFASPGKGDDLEPALREIIRAIRGVSFGSVEVIIHNSRVVQIERKEKVRLDAD